MDKIEIYGIEKLEGNIKISGSKNSSLPILAATLLLEGESRITNVPNLTDVLFMIKILKSLSSNVNFNNSICEIKPNIPKNLKVSYELVRKMRASFLILGLTSQIPIEIDDCLPIKTSFPNFIDIMRDLGANLELRDL